MNFNINPQKLVRTNKVDEKGDYVLDENNKIVVEEKMVDKTNDELQSEKVNILISEKGRAISLLEKYNFVWANQKPLNLTDDELYAKYTFEIDEWYKAYNLLQDVQKEAKLMGVEI